jgi:hypothetical protein
MVTAQLPEPSSGATNMAIAKPVRSTVSLRGATFFSSVLLMFVGQLFTQAADALPHSASLISDYQKHGLTVLDQGNRGDCSLFAITGLVEFEIDQHTPGEHPRLSEDYLIWAADEATGQTGDQAMFYKAVLGLNELGICNSADMPYLTKSEPSRTSSVCSSYFIAGY